MIRVDRNSVPMPTILRRGNGGPADREFVEAERFYSNYEANRQRGSFAFKLYRHKSVKDALAQLFHGKCAYCETNYLAVSPGDVELFRPKGGVIAANGTLLPGYYWWLAAEWSNLYFSCMDCNRVANRESGGTFSRSGKGGRFPLMDEARRAEVYTTGPALADEMPLLLDPCADDVENILLFSEDGMVASTDQRGLVTIEILGLNRKALLDARRAKAAHLRALLNMASLAQDSADAPQINDTLIEQIRSMIEPRAEYASMCRQIISKELEAGSPSLASLSDTDDLSATARMQSGLERSAKQALRDFQAQQEDYSLEAPIEEALPAYASIGTNLLFFEKGEPTKEVWYYEHQVPAGQKAYSMTRPIRLEHFQHCMDWWGGANREGRVEGPQAWKVTIKDIKARGYNLDIKNPHSEAEEHGDPEELLRELDAVEAEAANLRDQLKAIFAEALAR